MEGKPLNNQDIASLKRRFLALILDFIVIVCYGAVLFGVSMLVYNTVLGGIPSFNEFQMNLVSLTLIVPVVLYSIITESSGKHATLGKRKMKIKVASTSGQVRLRQIVVRNIIKFLPWQLAHMAIFHGFALQWELSPFWSALLIISTLLPVLWILFLFRKDRRGLHDLIAGTVVKNMHL
jgi:uncharacterized RDD family membrane protein YckC